MESGPSTVKAIHNFKGTNNDELCFKKGDSITVTQKVEGGWWEGTLNGVTGWFPSNYVKEIKLGDTIKANKTSVGKLGVPDSGDVQVSSQDMEIYRAVVYKDILDTEANHIQEMTDITQKYLNPLKNSDCITDKDWAILTSNFEEVLETQKSLMAALENLKDLSSKEQKIGGAFMQVAPHMKRVHLTYCSQHPKAVAIIEKHKESLNKFMEERGSTTSILPLTTGLSSPFRRLEKYPALLQELQRHTEESNLDRGDTQRAFYVYRDISAMCQNKRRQKEMELEVMTGTIRGWEGEDIHSLGTIIHMGVVTVISEDQKKKDRHLVLFPNTLVILAVSSRLSAFIYKGKLSLSGIKVTKQEHDENTPHAFEITGNMIQRLVVSCHSKEDLDTWISFFKQYHHVCHSATPPVVALRSIQNQHPSSSSSSSQVEGGGPNNSHVSQLQITLGPNSQQPPLPPHVMSGHNTVPKGSPKKVWTMWSLRPHPPIRTCPLVAKKDEVVMRRSGNKKREKVMDEKAYEDDMRVLQVIEAYCNSAKTRYTVNSAMLDCPQVIITEEEKIIVEDIKGNTSIVQEKTLVDTVYALKDQVKDLKEETANLARGLNEERKARKKLEEIVKKHLSGISREIFQGILED